MDGPERMARLREKVERIQRAKAKVLEEASVDAAEREAWARSYRCRQGKPIERRPQPIRSPR